MIPASAKILCEDKLVQISDIREENLISGAAGWGELGETKVNDVFVNYDHSATLVKLVTSKGSVVRCTPDQKCFGRINPLVRNYTLFLHERSNLGFRVGVSQDLVHDLINSSSLKHEKNQRRDVVDRIWIIETTSSLPAATFLEKYSVFKYGLPNIPFSSKESGADLSEKMTREIFNQVDTPSRAQDLLNDWHMFMAEPHIKMKLSDAGNPAGSAVQFIIFGGNEKNKKSGIYSHSIRINGAVDQNRAEHKQFKRKLSKHGLWFLEITRDDLEEADLFVKTLSHLDNLEVVKKIQLTPKSPFYILPASHIKPGMLVPVVNHRGAIEEDLVVSVDFEEYDGPLYNIQTRQFHNYIVGNWILMSYISHQNRIKREPHG